MWSLAFPSLYSTDDSSSDESKSEDPLFAETSSDNLELEIYHWTIHHLTAHCWMMPRRSR